MAGSARHLLESGALRQLSARYAYFPQEAAYVALYPCV